MAARRHEEARKVSKRASKSTNVPLAAIPYYAWANRGKGEMAVWLPRTADAIEGDDDASE